MPLLLLLDNLLQDLAVQCRIFVGGCRAAAAVRVAPSIDDGCPPASAAVAALAALAATAASGFPLARTASVQTVSCGSSGKTN